MIGVVIACNVYEAADVAATLEVNVGGPYQGDIRNLAADRWFPTYPS